MSNRALKERFFAKSGRVTRRQLGTKPKVTRKKSGGNGFSAMRRGLLIGAGATSVGLVGFSAFLYAEKSSIEPSVPRKLRIVLIDSSDRNTAVQDRLITRIVEQSAVDDIRGGDRLILLGLTADQNEPLEERFNQVSPPRGGEISPWQGDPASYEDVWKNTFLYPYVKDARDLREVVEKKQTPFLEALMQISSILGQYEAEEKSVVIVSDALQHIRNGLSAYTNDKRRNVTKMPAGFTDFYSPDFAGAQFKLVHILRNNARHRQGQDHRDWIDQILQSRNANLEYVGLS